MIQLTDPRKTPRQVLAPALVLAAFVGALLSAQDKPADKLRADKEALAPLLQEGRSYLVCELSWTLDGPPAELASAGPLSFLYGAVEAKGETYVGPGRGEGTTLYVRSLRPLRGDGAWALTQRLSFTDRTRASFVFTGEVTLPRAH